MSLSTREKQFVSGAAVSAVLAGAVCGFRAFSDAREHQLHGGVENEVDALWSAVSDAIYAFGLAAAPIFLVLWVLIASIHLLRFRGGK